LFRLRQTVAPVLLLALPLALGSCAESGPSILAEVLTRVDPPLSGTARSVLIISLDTVRADHLSVYGYERPTSPNLEAFAQVATLYTQARAASPWTLPSHATLFTGIYPFEHGARTYSKPRNVSSTGRQNNAGPLDREFLTLAELFARNGYRTAGFVANDGFLTSRWAIDQGFEEYDATRGYADDVNRRAFDWLEKIGDEPFFLFLNFMDAHRPYNSSPPEGFTDFGGPEASAATLKGLYPEVLGKPGLRPPEMFERLIGQYDNALANLDAGLGQLFDKLRELRIFEDLLIVITSDHGEYFGEHRLIEHSKDVYEGGLHVPLLIKAPGQAQGRRDDALVSHAHVPGIIISYAALSKITKAEAETLTRHWPRMSVIAENYYSRPRDLRAEWGARFDRVRQVVYDGDYKYIDSSDGKSELYDLSSDPEERVNLFARQPDVAARMSELLRSQTEATRRSETVEVSEDLTDEEIEALRALGYLDDAG
jgi:arylsulfatase A-like enzyme